MIDMTETAAQRDAERVREHAPKLLVAAQVVRMSRGWQYMSDEARCVVEEAIEYATGAHDPACYAIPETGYDVDADGTFTG